MIETKMRGGRTFYSPGSGTRNRHAVHCNPRSRSTRVLKKMTALVVGETLPTATLESATVTDAEGGSQPEDDEESNPPSEGRP